MLPYKEVWRQNKLDNPRAKKENEKKKKKKSTSGENKRAREKGLGRPVSDSEHPAFLTLSKAKQASTPDFNTDKTRKEAQRD